jgi:hypothetical protein
MPTTGDEDVVSDVDEPPEPSARPRGVLVAEFHRSSILPQGIRKESLLTKALQTSPSDVSGHEVQGAPEMFRRRSGMSTTSTATTADLTSDEGITSPARTNTPSPPPSTSTYLNLASYVLGRKPTDTSVVPMVQQDPRDFVVSQISAADNVPQPDPALEALVKKRCITFACGAQKPKSPLPPAPKSTATLSSEKPAEPAKDAPKRTSIKFACPGPKPVEKQAHNNKLSTAGLSTAQPIQKAALHRHHSRSPSITRKMRSTPPPNKLHRDSAAPGSTVRGHSRSPVALKTRRPAYIAADEEALRRSEATRFHEFASDEPQEDDWIAKDNINGKAKLTINDTLKKENAIRQLGKEVEDEAILEEEDEEDDEEETLLDSDDDNEDDEENVEDGPDDETIDGSDNDASDGNETDNEAGFADSDDESDAAGDDQFWTPGHHPFDSSGTEINTFRTARSIPASESSIDSIKNITLAAPGISSKTPKRRRVTRKMKIRPGTPDLPDSTDFVCGTLDEDRPLEEAYLSCMRAREQEKLRLIPQDIDPSFPTSDPENEDEDDVPATNDSDEHVWLHGKFEDSDDDRIRRRRPSARRTPAPSPKRLHSPPPKQRLRSPPPKRLHSPPPPKQRLRSPPPRRLFGQSPKRVRSPPPARNIQSPAASPAAIAVPTGIRFAPLGQRPGLTHTKSLPRTPNAFIHQYRIARLAAMDDESEDTVSGHTRGAIDIVKGLEHKRQRRKEKLYQKLCNRARKGQQPKKPQPGKGAERMRDLGLQLAGKVEERQGQAAYVISL